MKLHTAPILVLFAVLFSGQLPHALKTASADDNASRPPNIILIMADDLGFECIGANGGTSYKTPVLDKLAETGVRFNHCYSQPLCTPSRVQIMTGQYNIRNYERFGVLPRSQTTFANLFRKAGYETCVVGKWQLGTEADSPDHFGFDRHCLWHFRHRAERFPNPGLDIDGKRVQYDRGEYGPDVVSDYACKFMEENRERPFLLYYPMILTHCPFCPTSKSKDWDPKNKGSKTYKGDAKYFGDMVTHMDSIVGKLVAKLEQLKLRNDTLILFTGDNGTDKPVVSKMGDREVAGNKRSMKDGGTRVPLIACCPGRIKKGVVSNDLIDFSDFLPTICEAAEIEIPKERVVDGVSCWPQLQGKKGNPREWIYVWFSREGGDKGQQFTRNQRYKLYASGKFFDVQKDVLEKAAIEEPDLTESQKFARQKLQSALNKFKDARPPEVAARGKQNELQKSK